MRSIIEEMEDRGFIRIKCGIGRPPAEEDVADYVLRPLQVDEDDIYTEMVEKIEHAVNLIVLQGKKAAMNEINRSG